MFDFIHKIERLISGHKSNEEYAREARRMHGQQTEKQIDKTLADSFPASDPPSWY